MHSVARALEAAGARVDVTADSASIDGCDALCVPGQGIFGRCMANLSARRLDELIRKWVADRRPFLGICIGMQILFDASEESSSETGLGILRGRVERLPATVTVPHIGWNTLSSTEASPGWLNDEYFYFDHSYAVQPDDGSIVDAWFEHGGRWAAVVGAGSVTATLFHPEKSGAAGIHLLRGWLAGSLSGDHCVVAANGRDRES